MSIANRDEISNIILFAAFAIFLISFSTSKLSNEDDYFWHLAVGRYILEKGEFPKTDPFGFAIQGQQWLATVWGWDILTYQIYKLSGYEGLSILTPLIFLIIFSLFYRMAARLNVSISVLVPLLVILLFGLFERLTPRPHLISFLFLALLLYIIVSYKYSEPTSVRKIFFVPLIFLLWTNMHLGVLAGVVLWLIFVISEIITHPPFGTPPRRGFLLRILLVTLILGLALLVNPYGLELYKYIFSSFQMKSLSFISEWISPFNEQIRWKFNLIIYYIFLGGGVLTLFYAFKKKDLFTGLVVLLFGMNSFRAVRYTNDYMFVVFIFLALSLSFFLNRIHNQKIRSYILSSRHFKAVLSLLLIILTINIHTGSLYYYLNYNRTFGSGTDSSFYPVRAMQFISDNNLHRLCSKPFNTYETGGFFIWYFPESKNFIDSRVVNDFIMNEYDTIYTKRPGYEKKIEQYNFDYSICFEPSMISYPAVMKGSVISYFCNNENWKCVYWDDRTMFFVKDLPQLKDIISKYEYKYVTPYNFLFAREKLEENKEGMKQEIERKKAEDPNSIYLNSIIQYYQNQL